MRDCFSGGDMFPSCLTVKDTLIVNQNSANKKSMSYLGDILSLARNVECSSFSRPVFTAALTIRDTLQRSGVLLNQLYTAPIMSTALKTN